MMDKRSKGGQFETRYARGDPNMSEGASWTTADL